MKSARRDSGTDRPNKSGQGDLSYEKVRSDVIYEEIIRQFD